MHEAKTKLSKIVETVEKTKQPIIIARHGKAVVKIVPLEVSPKAPLKGALKNKIAFAPDYDQADKEVEALFT